MEDKIEVIVKDLKAKGLKGDEIIKALEQLVQEQKLTEEELEKAKEILKEREDAEKLFDMQF